MQPDHSKLLNQAAKKILAPLGARQRGRSRLWYDDHDWWLIVIEFQPGRSAGSYLNVGAMWLWYEKDYFSFDYESRVESFHSFQGEAQFLPVAEGLAMRAAEEINRYRLQYGSVRSVAHHLTARTPRGFWDDLNTGIACGLAEEPVNATRFFRDVIAANDDRDWAQAAKALAQKYDAMQSDFPAFQREIQEVVLRARRALKLDDIQPPNFGEVV